VEKNLDEGGGKRERREEEREIERTMRGKKRVEGGKSTG
jgi:hypothetical protein